MSTARAGNVIGGGDFAPDRILPDCVRAMEKGIPIIVRNPCSVRPYQHVLEPVMAYLMIAAEQYENRNAAGWYNVGPDEASCVTTGKLVSLFCEAWGEKAQWENHAEHNPPHEASMLKLDCSRIKSIFNWRPRWEIEEAVKKTVEWSRAYLNGEDISAVMDGQINEFLRGER